MSGIWHSVAFADLITERKERFEPDAPEIRGLTKIDKIDFAEGKLHLTEYEPTKTQQIIVEPGDFVFSGLNIEKGAVGFNETGERLVVSANYSTCGYDDSRVSLDFFKHYMRSQNFQRLLRANLKKDYGFTRPKHLMPLTFLVPRDKREQERIVHKYEQCKATHTELRVEIAHQESLLNKLKQAILQEAIQGKLTADWRAAHPDVEPASQLLHRIHSEKARLIAAKKLRPEKPLAKISPAEIPFEIPQGWQWCRYGDLCEYVTSGSRGWQQFYADTGALFIRAQNIKTDKLCFDDEAFVDLPNKAEGLRARVLKDDVLITITGGNLGKTALVEDEFEEAYVSQHIALTRLVDTKLAKWSHLTLTTDRGPRGVLLGYSRGDKPGLNLPNVRHVPIPLPPRSEQAAILERVQGLMATCRSLESEIEHTRAHAAHLLQAVLKEAFAPAA